jgi:hypothetical protein
LYAIISVKQISQVHRGNEEDENPKIRIYSSKKDGSEYEVEKETIAVGI